MYKLNERLAVHKKFVTLIYVNNYREVFKKKVKSLRWRFSQKQSTVINH